MTDPRPDVVALLVDIESLGAFPKLIRRSTGKPFTADEILIVGDARRAEMEAARAHMVAMHDQVMREGEDLDRVAELARPYFENLPESANMADVAMLMPRAEAAALISILERLA